MPIFVFLAALAVSGCASQNTRTITDEFGGPASARDYGDVRAADGRRQGTGDLWARVRAGMRLNATGHGQVEDKISAFRHDPQFLAKLSERARPYLHVVIDEIERRGLPAELALLPHVESRYNPAATSPVAAAGMWQFMPGTGRVMGLRQDAWHDERRDVLASTRAALDYLEQLHARLGGDWELAMAAYNCGPARVESAQAANRARGLPTDFWSLSLPRETAHYVPQILAASRLVAEPAHYGVALPPIPSAPQLEVIRTERPVNLAQIAALSGVDLVQLRTLNAGLKRDQTPPLGPGRLVLPAGTGARVTAALPQAQVMAASALATTRPGPAPALPAQAPARAGATAAAEVHVVRRGETLAGIAGRYAVSVEDLRRWNPVAAYSLRHGEELRIYRHAPEFAAL